VLSTAATGAFCLSTPVAFLRYSFLGWRGNQRWKVLFDNPDDISFVDATFGTISGSTGYYLNPHIIIPGATTYIDPGAMTTTSQIAASALGATVAEGMMENGFARMHPQMGDAAEFEVPDYNLVRFHVGTTTTVTTLKSDMVNRGCFLFRTRSVPSGTGLTDGVVSSYATILHSAGEDFNLFFFTYARPFYLPSTGMTANVTDFNPVAV